MPDAHRGYGFPIGGVAEEAPGAYKDVRALVDAADRAGLSRKVATLDPLVCVKGRESPLAVRRRRAWNRGRQRPWPAGPCERS